MLRSLAVIAAGIFWGTMGLFVRYFTAAGFSQMQIAFFRVLITLIIIGVYVLIKDRSLLKIKLRDIWCFLGTGIIAVPIFSYCYYTTITLTSMSTASILLYTSPIFVMLMSIMFFKEKLTPSKLAALVIAFAGCFLVSGFGGALNAKGIIIGLGAGFFYALYSIFSRFAANRGYGSLTITFYTFLFATIGTFPISNVGDAFSKVASSPSLIPMVILLAVISCSAPYLLYTWGLMKLETSRAAILASVEPVTATILGSAVYKEPLTPSGFGGIVLVLAAIAVLTLGSKTLTLGSKKPPEVSESAEPAEASESDSPVTDR